MDLRIKIGILTLLVFLISLVSAYNAGSILYKQGVSQTDKSLNIAGEFLINNRKSQRAQDKLVADDIALEPRIFDLVKNYVTANEKRREKILSHTHLSLIEIINELYPTSSGKQLKIEILTNEALILADQLSPHTEGVPKAQFSLPEESEAPDVLYGVWGDTKLFNYTASKIGDEKGTYGWVMVSRALDEEFLRQLSTHTHTAVSVLHGERMLGTTLPHEIILSSISKILVSSDIFFMGGSAGGFTGTIFGLKEYRSIKIPDNAVAGVSYILSVSTGELASSMGLIFLFSLIFAITLVALTGAFGYWFFSSVNNSLRYPILILKRGLEGQFEPESPPSNLPTPFGDIAYNAYRVVMQIRSSTSASTLGPIIKPQQQPINKIDNLLQAVPSAPPSQDAAPQMSPAMNSLPFLTSQETALPSKPEEDDPDPLGIFSEKPRQSELASNPPRSTGEYAFSAEEQNVESFDESPTTDIQSFRGEESPATDEHSLFGEMGEITGKYDNQQPKAEAVPAKEEEYEEEEQLRYDEERTMIASQDEFGQYMGVEKEEEEEQEDEEEVEAPRYDEERTMIASADDIDSILGMPGEHASDNYSEPPSDYDSEMPFEAPEPKAASVKNHIEVNPDEYSEDSLNELLGSFDETASQVEAEEAQEENYEEEAQAEEPDGNATTVLQVPKGFWDNKPVVDESEDQKFESHARQVYEEYLNIRMVTGESSDNLAFEKFFDQLKKNKEALIKKHNCADVRFEAYEKNGKAALKASPIK